MTHKGRAAALPRKYGPNGRRLPDAHRGSYFVHPGPGLPLQAVNAKGQPIERAVAIERLARQALKKPDLYLYLPKKLHKIPVKRRRRQDYGGYKPGKYDLVTMDPKRLYVILFDALIIGMPYDAAADESVKDSGAIVRSYTLGTFTRRQIRDLGRREMEAMATEVVESRLDPRKGQALLEILGFWRRPQPQLRRRND